LKFFPAALLVLATVLAFAGPGYAFKENGASCIKCHNLSEKEMVPILEKVNLATAKVIDIRMSPIKGLWEVAVENKGKPFIVYVDFSKKFITPGPLIDYANRIDLTRERVQALKKDSPVNVEGLSLRDALVLGRASAPIKLIVFTDPACPYCAKLHKEMKTLVAKRADIVFYLKIFTLVSPDPKVAQTVVCEKSLALLEDAYGRKDVPSRPCASKEIDDNMRFVEANGIDAAPAVIFPDGTVQLGYSDAASLEKRIDEAAAAKKKAGNGGTAGEHSREAGQ
jgi:thiol:disulfide interchange protein DsbC